MSGDFDAALAYRHIHGLPDELPGAIVIGRAETCQLRIDDEYASPRHCQIWQDDKGRVLVADLGSTNGTWLLRNGAEYRIRTTTPIHPGDSIRVGRTTIPWTPR